MTIQNPQKIAYTKYFKGKKITLMGLGGFPRSLIEAEFLAQAGADLIITDRTPAEDLQKELKVLEKYQNISYTLGEHKVSDFKNRDIVFSANGVPLGNKYIETAKKYSKVVTKTVAYTMWILHEESKRSDFEVKTIGVTGTKGKSTTTSMIFHMLSVWAEEKNEKRWGEFLKDFSEGKILQELSWVKKIKDIQNISKEEIDVLKKYFDSEYAQAIFTGGNVRGTANLPLLKNIKSGDFFVAELDSWLLQGFGSLEISPHIAVFTNLYNDHQNYYHSMERYFADKKYITDFQTRNDLLVLTKNSKKAFALYGKSRKGRDFSMKQLKANKVLAKKYTNPEGWNYTVFGEHNMQNIAQAREVGVFLNIPESIQKKTFETYESEEGRLQKLPNKKGIIFINDNNATMPEASGISLEAVRKAYPKSRIFLLAGGADKDFDKKSYQKLAQKYEENSFFTVYFSGTGTDILMKYFSTEYLKNKKENFEIVSTMEEAMENILSKAKKGDIVMLSPGMASFGCFKNEYDKNDQFLEKYREIE